MMTALMTVLLIATWKEVAVSNVPVIPTALLLTGEEAKPAELNAVLIQLASSLSLANLMPTALLELLLVLLLKRSVWNACLMLTVVNPSLLVRLVNKDVSSASMTHTAPLEKNADLTKLAAPMMMMMILTSMEPLFLAS
jgi:hypothetical protein